MRWQTIIIIKEGMNSPLVSGGGGNHQLIFIYLFIEIIN
jgi:hypothetical protein